MELHKTENGKYFAIFSPEEMAIVYSLVGNTAPADVGDCKDKVGDKHAISRLMIPMYEVMKKELGPLRKRGRPRKKSET